MKPDAGVADADGVAVDDAGDAGQCRLGLLLGLGLCASVTMVITGRVVVVAAFLVQPAAVGVGGGREQNQERRKKERHYGTTGTPQEIK